MGCTLHLYRASGFSGQERKMAYLIYTRMLPSGGRHASRRDVFMLIGPVTELTKVKTMNSVGSRRCPNVVAEYIGQGDSRYSGPRSGVGMAIAEARRQAEERGLHDAAVTIEAWRAMKARRAQTKQSAAYRDHRVGHHVAYGMDRAREAGIHRKHVGLIGGVYASGVDARVRAILRCYRLGVSPTPDFVGRLQWSVDLPTLRQYRPEIAVAVEIARATGSGAPDVDQMLGI